MNDAWLHVKILAERSDDVDQIVRPAIQVLEHRLQMCRKFRTPIDVRLDVLPVRVSVDKLRCSARRCIQNSRDPRKNSNSVLIRRRV